MTMKNTMNRIYSRQHYCFIDTKHWKILQQEKDNKQNYKSNKKGKKQRKKNT